MSESQLHAISPIDGRYKNKTKELSAYFSEYALIRYRILVEVEYFIALCKYPLPELQNVTGDQLEELRNIYVNFTVEAAKKVKEFESVTNHDVKAVEYYIKDKFDELGLSKFKEFIHFGLTSQDINNTANPIMLQDAIRKIIKPNIKSILDKIEGFSDEWKDIPMLARTHGQPASPTTLGKEFRVFWYRINKQFIYLNKFNLSGKFGGATGNFNAHKVAYPEINWINFANVFLKEALGIERQNYTTQIDQYDDLATLLQCMSRINTILIDFCRDLWTYISMDYFKQKIIANEVGSSAMPHKVNPIDFENAEGNLGIANSILIHLASKLPLSRLQRDLTDSTVLRNIGTPFAHTLIALKAIHKGLDKLLLNKPKLDEDLENNWAVISEAIQTILRKEGYPQPYEALKGLTRSNEKIDKASIHKFIDGLKVDNKIKQQLKEITPFNYTGITISA